jgi:pimeloyl-ACP methyl ester carboxylesterase
MGGMISLLEAAAAPGLVNSLILVGPALRFAPVRPGPLVAAVPALATVPVLGSALAGLHHRQPREHVVARTLSLCCADASSPVRGGGPAAERLRRGGPGLLRGRPLRDARRSPQLRLRRAIATVGAWLGSAR